MECYVISRRIKCLCSFETGPQTKVSDKATDLRSMVCYLTGENILSTTEVVFSILTV